MAGSKNFPKSLEDFKDDERISFDSTKGVYILEDADGKEYEWMEKYSNWVEQMDEELVKAQQSAYYAAQDEEAEARDESSKKRKSDDKSASENKKAKKEPVQRVNSSVYVTGLPKDATSDELFDIFSRKGGLIANNIDSETPRIKMYAEDDGSFKGEALITFFRPESVQMAIDLLDGTDLRTYMSGDMRVQEADMSYKKSKEYQQNSGEKKKGPGKDVNKIKKMTEKMNNRLADWDDDDPQVLEEEVKPASKFDKTEEPELLLELPEDIREKAEEEDWGAITTIDVFDKEPDGVVKIRFKDAKCATKAVMNMDGRIFAGKQLVAYIPDKREVYRKSDRDVEEEEEERRLKKYGEELERGEA
ncbi:Splicing factor U2AF-associated protein 2 [Elsinoe australis]|uniref:Splicing factor U2AF-associated protein 2 n=1 Tax=Elsinoe australis TaxID=40998 RepID=A0A2P8A4L3_9PEZI|nr:Splicing factor U2AF-associated protein 2 [Elsinoe australis]